MARAVGPHLHLMCSQTGRPGPLAVPHPNSLPVKDGERRFHRGNTHSYGECDRPFPLFHHQPRPLVVNHGFIARPDYLIAENQLLALVGLQRQVPGQQAAFVIDVADRGWGRG